jgi:hypothetical protein
MAILDSVTIGPLAAGDSYVYTFPAKLTKPDYVLPTTNTSISVTAMTTTSVTFQNVGSSSATATFVLSWFYGDITRDASNPESLELGWDGSNAGASSTLELIANGVVWYPSGGGVEEAGRFYGTGCTVYRQSANSITIETDNNEIYSRLIFCVTPIGYLGLAVDVSPFAGEEPGKLFNVFFTDNTNAFVQYTSFTFAIWRQPAYDAVTIPIPTP